MEFRAIFVFVVVFMALMLNGMRTSATHIDKILLRQRREHTPHYKWLMAGGALLLLAYIGFATLRDAKAMNTEKTVETLNIRIPTQAVKPPTVRTNPADARSDVASARLLCTLLLFDRQPIHTETVELNWPDEDTITRTFNLKGSQAFLSIQILKAYYQTVSNHDRFTADAKVYCNHKKGWMDGGTFSGQFQINQYSNLGGFSDSPFSLSLAHAKLPQIHVMMLVAPAAEDDPLKNIPVSELFNNSEAFPGQELILNDRYGVEANNPLSDFGKETGIFFVDLVARFTIPFLLLCFMMPLLTAPFRNKALAVAVILTLGVFYFVALDRMVLNTRLQILQNPSADVELQKQAVINSTDTFFYRNIAAKTIQTFIDRTDVSEDVKKVGNRSVAALISGKNLIYIIYVDTDEPTQEG